MAESKIRLLEQERARVAWNCINYVNEKYKEKFKKEYRSLVMRLPAMIITNGLGQALAFLKSKGKSKESKPHEKLFKDIESWFSGNENIQWDKTQGGLMEKVINLPSDKFRHATSETLSFFSWMKRFADAVLPKGDE